MSRGRFGARILAAALATTMAMSNVTVYAADETTVTEVVEQVQEGAPASEPASQEPAPASQPSTSVQESAPAAQTSVPATEAAPAAAPAVQEAVDPAIQGTEDSQQPAGGDVATGTETGAPATTDTTVDGVGEEIETGENVEASENVEPGENVEIGENVETGENVEPGEDVDTDENVETDETEVTGETEKVEENVGDQVTNQPVQNPSTTVAQPAQSVQKAPAKAAARPATPPVIENNANQADEQETAEEIEVSDMDAQIVTEELVDEVKAVEEVVTYAGDAAPSNAPEVNNAAADEAMITRADGTTQNYGTLAEAIAAAQEDETVTLLKDTTANITVTKSITLDLDGKTLTGVKDADDEGVASVITVLNETENNLKVTIKNGSITGGQSKNGGAINSSTYQSGSRKFTANDLVLETLKLFGNNVSNGYGGLGNGAGRGGAVYVEGGSLTLNGVEIYNNSATDGGGAIHVDNAALTIMNKSYIHDNQARQGGGLKVAGDSSGTIDDTTFSNNKTTGNLGGAIYQGTGYNLTITNSTLNNNTSETSGGAIAVSDGNLAMKDVTFKENSAQEGGAVYVWGVKATTSTITATNVTATGNKATGNYLETKTDGGAFYLKGNVKATFTGTTTLTNNSAVGAGGGIAVSTHKAGKNIRTVDLTVANGVKIYNNSAEKKGDDLFIGAGNKLRLARAKDMNAQLNGKNITGWFYDGLKDDEDVNRWSVDDYYDEFTDVTDVDIITLALGDEEGLGFGLKAAYAPTPEPTPTPDPNPNPNPGPDPDPNPTPAPVNTNVTPAQQAEIETIVEYGDQGTEEEIPTIVEYGAAGGAAESGSQIASQIITAYGNAIRTGDDSLMVVYGAAAAMAAGILALWFASHRRHV